MPRPRFKHPGRYIADLGEGNIGTVCAVEYEGKQLALKYGHDESILDEAKVYEQVAPHPHILRCYGSGEIPGEEIYWILLERFDYNLLSYKHPRQLDPKRVFREVLLGLTHLHSQGYVHGDLHTGNVGIVGDRTVIFDLGFARRLRHPKTGEMLLPSSVVRKDLETFLRFAFETPRLVPWSASPQKDLAAKLEAIRDAAVLKGKIHLAHYLLEVAPAADFESLASRAFWSVPSLRLVLAMQSQHTGQSVATLSRQILQGKFLRMEASCLELLCQWAGMLDNPEFPPVFSASQAIDMDISSSVVDLVAPEPHFFAFSGGLYSFAGTLKPQDAWSARIDTRKGVVLLAPGGETFESRAELGGQTRNYRNILVIFDAGPSLTPPFREIQPRLEITGTGEPMRLQVGKTIRWGSEERPLPAIAYVRNVKGVQIEQIK